MKTGRLLDVDIHSDLIEDTYGAQGLLIYLVQNIYAHKGEGSFLRERPQDLSCINSPRRTISGDVCGDSAYQRAKGIEYA